VPVDRPFMPEVPEELRHDMHFELFNHTVGYRSTWMDHLAPGNRLLPAIPWISRFPGVRHLPDEVLTFELDVQLDPAYVVGARRLFDLFHGAATPGQTDIAIPVDQLQALLACPDYAATHGVVLHKIELCEVHSTLPVPVQVQLQTASCSDGEVRPSTWFRQTRTNALSAFDASPMLGALTVYPDTHHVHEEPALLFEAAEITRGPDFNRWINTTLKQARASLHKLTEVYRQDTPQDAALHPCVSLPPLKHYNDPVHPTQVHEQARDVLGLASFLCLDEWRRLEQMAVSQNLELDKYCVIKYDPQADRLFFTVHCRLLDHILEEKFTGPMERALHVARTDKPWVVRVSLQHTAPGSFDRPKQRLRQTLEALHPTVLFPGDDAAASNVRGPAPIGTRTESESAPKYALQLRLRVSCARLESLTVPKPDTRLI